MTTKETLLTLMRELQAKQASPLLIEAVRQALADADRKDKQVE